MPAPAGVCTRMCARILLQSSPNRTTPTHVLGQDKLRQYSPALYEGRFVQRVQAGEAGLTDFQTVRGRMRACTNAREWMQVRPMSPSHKFEQRLSPGPPSPSSPSYYLARANDSQLFSDVLRPGAARE